MFSARQHPNPIISCSFFFVACLLLSGIASAAPSITLSRKTGPPTSKVLVWGSGFAPHAKIDIYFDTKDEALAMADGSGSFSQTAIAAPASALERTHWVSAVDRADPALGQAKFLVLTNWSQFHRRDMTRFNPYEKFLTANNVGDLGLKWSYATGGSVSSSAAVANGVVYLGSWDGNVYALDAHTGVKLWTFATPRPSRLLACCGERSRVHCVRGR